METRRAYLVQLILAPLGVEDGGLVSVVEEMASRDEAITAYAAGASQSWSGPQLARCRCSPLFPGPQATRTRRPLFSGWTRYTVIRQQLYSCARGFGPNSATYLPVKRIVPPVP